ncbi:MAG: fibronectin type III domain-containing protein [Candidatus Diapherotrites archaeon]|nr:fibronectin type III domain-containing protein [Candidatus Diapherotrites archaeon]
MRKASLFLTAILLCFLLPAALVSAQKLLVQPANGIASLNSNFDVNISAESISNLYGFQFDVQYNGSVISFQNARFANIIGIVGTDVWCTDSSIWQVGSGLVSKLTCVRMATGGITANGTLATLTFHADTNYFSGISIVNAQLSNNSGQPIAFTVTNGSVSTCGHAIACFQDSNCSAGQTCIQPRSCNSYCQTTTDTNAPNTPTNFRSTANTTNSISLAWNANPETDLNSYKIYKNNVFLIKVNKPTVTYTAIGLTQNTDYNFQITALDHTQNESPRSGILTIKTDPISADNNAPNTPANFRVSTKDSNSVTLAWNANFETDLNAYRIYSNGALVTKVNKPAITYKVTGLTPNTDYNFQISALDNVGNESNLSANLPAKTNQAICVLPQLSCSGNCIVPACDSNSACNDSNANTIDVCNNPSSCTASCTHTLITCTAGKILCTGSCITPTCTLSSQCNDNNPLTLDICTNAGLCNALCVNSPTDPTCTGNQILCNHNCTTPYCSSGAECDDSNPSTSDSCTSPGTCSSTCVNNTITQPPGGGGGGGGGGGNPPGGGITPPVPPPKKDTNKPVILPPAKKQPPKAVFSQVVDVGDYQIISVKDENQNTIKNATLLLATPDGNTQVLQPNSNGEFVFKVDKYGKTFFQISFEGQKISGEFTVRKPIINVIPGLPIESKKIESIAGKQATAENGFLYFLILAAITMLVFTTVITNHFMQTQKSKLKYLLIIFIAATFMIAPLIAARLFEIPGAVIVFLIQAAILIKVKSAIKEPQTDLPANL